MSDLVSELFQCETRAALLRLLLVEKRAASVSELARRCGLSPRAVGKEVAHLERLHLAMVTHEGASRVVRAAWEHPACALLASLLTLAPHQPTGNPQALRESLAAYGAPLVDVARQAHMPPEAALLGALEAARTDGTVLRVLPVVVAHQRARLDWVELLEGARKAGLKSELGFLLTLTGDLLGDESLKGRAVALRDRRRSRMVYFPEPRNRFERQLAEEASPAVAKAWGFFMNMSVDSFRSLMAKHGPVPDLA
jgi:AcrR family transcriptional regulator